MLAAGSSRGGRCVPTASSPGGGGAAPALTWRALPHTATTPTGPRVALSTASASRPSSNLPASESHLISSSGTPWALRLPLAAAGAGGGVAEAPRLPNQPLIASRCPLVSCSSCVSGTAVKQQRMLQRCGGAGLGGADRRRRGHSATAALQTVTSAGQPQATTCHAQSQQSIPALRLHCKPVEYANNFVK